MKTNKTTTTKTHRKQECVAQACNLSTWEAGVVESGIQGHLQEKSKVARATSGEWSLRGTTEADNRDRNAIKGHFMGE